MALIQLKKNLDKDKLQFIVERYKKKEEEEEKGLAYFILLSLSLIPGYLRSKKL